ncbi:unnamed protein product, partial [Ectocarpus sp. 12 AP-2014]
MRPRVCLLFWSGQCFLRHERQNTTQPLPRQIKHNVYVHKTQTGMPLAMPCASLQNDSTTNKKQSSQAPPPTSNACPREAKTRRHSMTPAKRTGAIATCCRSTTDTTQLNKTPSKPSAVSFCRYTPTRQQQQRP